MPEEVLPSARTVPGKRSIAAMNAEANGPMGRFRRWLSLSGVFRTIDAERHGPLPAYGHRYFDQVLTEYLASGLSNASPPDHIKAIIAKHDAAPTSPPDPGKELTWADLYLLEKYILRNQPFDLLRRRAWSLRAKYREIVGQKAFDAYIDSKPPNENQADLTAEMLRVDLDLLLDGVHWSYALVPIRERMRTSVLKFIGTWMLLFLILVLGLVFLAARWDPPKAATAAAEKAATAAAETAKTAAAEAAKTGAPETVRTAAAGAAKTAVAAAARLTDIQLAARQAYDLPVTLLLVAFAGALGGFVSLQRRIQMIPTDGDPLVSIFELQNGMFSVYLAPLLGATFAIVLFFIFLGGYLSGALFPAFTLPSLSLGSFVWPGARMSGPVFAQLMIWSFVAGFAERFVPDTLTRLVDRGREASTSSNSPLAPAPPFPLPTSPPVAPRPQRSPPFE
jgi:hypothetical protein